MESSQLEEESNQLLRVAEVLAARVHVENEVDASVVLPNESVGSFVKRLWNEKRKIRRAEDAARLEYSNGKRPPKGNLQTFE